MRYLNMILVPLLAAGACWWMAQRFGPWPALWFWAVGMGLGCAVSALLLKTSTIGRITWKNIFAGFFLRWGIHFGGGLLPRIAVASWIISVLFGAAIIFGSTYRPGGVAAPEAAGPSQPSQVAVVLLVASWILCGAALIYILGVMSKDFRPSSRHTQTLAKILLVLIGMIAASVALHAFGHTGWALLITGGPIAFIAVIAIVFFLVILINGKNMRWN